MPYSSKEKRIAAYRARRGDLFRVPKPTWSMCNWDSGSITKHGRFRVKFPSHPEASNWGYVYRSHAVWYVIAGDVVPSGHVLHHKNFDILDDRFENLELLSRQQHAKLHHIGRRNPKAWVELTCKKCGTTFLRERWRVNMRIKDGYKSTKCSVSCKG